MLRSPARNSKESNSAVEVYFQGCCSLLTSLLPQPDASSGLGVAAAETVAGAPSLLWGQVASVKWHPEVALVLLLEALLEEPCFDQVPGKHG